MPFKFAYINEVEDFLERVTKDFKLSLTENLFYLLSCIGCLYQTQESDGKFNFFF